MGRSAISVGVLMGGISSEHDVSLESGQMILQSLDPEKFTPFPIIITRHNQWRWPDHLKWDGGNTLPLEAANLPESWVEVEFPKFSSFPRCDIMFVGLHGKGGEDGTLQGFLDLCGQQYTGSGSLGSALAMNKSFSKKLLKDNGVLSPDYRRVFLSNNVQWDNLLQEIPFPVVLKDPLGGSSLGVYIAKNIEELNRAADELSQTCDEIIVEEFVSGREATCGYLTNYTELAPTEIIPGQDAFFNYRAKYDSTRTREVTPGDFTTEEIAELQSLARKCHQIHGLSVYSRTDFILKEDKIYALEINSLPGLTKASLLPQAAAHSGLNFKELLSKIIGESLKK